MSARTPAHTLIRAIGDIHGGDGLAAWGGLL